MASEQTSRAVRLFTCPACGHRLRLSATACGKCYEPTPFHNRRFFWYAALLATAAAVSFVVVSGTKSG